MIPLNPRVDDIINRFRKISSDKGKKYSKQDMKDLISLCLDGVVSLYIYLLLLYLFIINHNIYIYIYIFFFFFFFFFFLN